MGLFCDPERVRPRRALTGLMIAFTSALAVLAAGCAGSTAPSTSSTPFSVSSAVTAQRTSSPGGAIHFPATLFGLHRNTSADAQKVAHSFTQVLAMMGMFTHSQAALYGSNPTGHLFIVGVAELTAAAKKYGGKTSASSVRRAFLVQGSQDAQTFPAGAPGTVLGCGHVTRAGTTETLCVRYDKKTLGMAVYLNGSASSLSDAASKTNQAISAIGG
jgi:hypothetical protein